MRIFKHYVPWNLALLVSVESFLIFVIFCAGHILEHYFSIQLVWKDDSHIYLKALTTTFIAVTTFYIAGVYDLRLNLKRGELCAKITLCLFITTFFVAALGFFMPAWQLGRQHYLFSSLIFLPTIIVFRLLYSWAVQITKEKVLILGTNETAIFIAKELTNGIYPGYEVQGFVTDNTTSSIHDFSEHCILGHVKDLQDIVRDAKPGVLVVALSERRGTFPYREILDCKLRGIKVEDWPTFYEKLTGKIVIHNLRPSWLIFSEGFTTKRFTSLVKRTVDVILSIVGLCLTFPLMVLIAIIIKFDSVGPVFFRQERSGENGKIFTLTKFRTMVADAEKHTGPIWAQTTDTRTTKVGHILRRTGLDEIPQMFNVLQGHMSFVGPRPERPYFVKELQEKIPYYALRLTVKPGITGWAQVRYGYGATFEDAIEKLQFDLYYIKNMSFFLDLLVVLSTIHKVVSAKVAVQTKPSEPPPSLSFLPQNGAGYAETSRPLSHIPPVR